MSTPTTTENMRDLLLRAFGFGSFRANQEAVCRAAIEGKDALLVMPTGAGKSLCYQLPAIARGGTTLVISPLIALMEDQSSKLAALGFAVARLHSGMDRSALREACMQYLNGALQFLFIAPERFRVPGFAEMLAKRKPSLIAIDEAHCISQWGHDFRPDYRTLGQHLPALRPAPILALTATATPLVQDDIVRQLSLVNASKFIHGFRRDNLAIEVVEVVRNQRGRFAGEILGDPARRPAIVYAPTRRDAESIAVELSALFPAAAYHAGLEPAVRERVQRAFLEGRLQAVVATIAFGMGIDKADVRTVIHTALPASLEAYYQEIGRAGRDGKPSRTILMHSYADRRTHDFFFERDYPPVDVLDRIYRKLKPESVHRELLRDALCSGKAAMDPETFDKAFEKLTVHGGSLLDYSEEASRGHNDWRDAYSAQAERRRAQIDLVVRYAEAKQCRMSSLVRHFGHVKDGLRPCGCCDFCSPERCVAQQFREPTGQEQKTLQEVLQVLRTGGPKSTGKLHKEMFPREDLSRNDFEDLLGAAATAGLVLVEDASFEKDGRSIAYRKVSLTPDGRDLGVSEQVEFHLKDTKEKGAGRAKPKRDRARSPQPKAARVPERAVAASPVSASPGTEVLEEKLKAWRMERAKELGQL